jgi:hypothetical protein
MNLWRSFLNYFMPVKTYIVKKGRHYASGKAPRPVKLYKERCWVVKTNMSWAYIHPDEADQTAVNKVIGLSEFVDPHVNSWRIGYSYDPSEDVINLHWYSYENELRSNEIVKKIKLGESFSLEVNEAGGFFLDHVYVGRMRTRANYGFLLEPYFGGRKRAPHDWKIVVKNL